MQREQAQAADEAERSGPEAVAVREESRTRYEGLDSEQAMMVAGEAFPAVVDEAAGGPPRLGAGERVTGYLADDVARVELPEGKHGVVASLAPLAVETGPGERAPLDLSLSEAGGAFVPKLPAVGVRIPKRLGEGVQLSDSGVSLTAVDAQGAALGGAEGWVDGASVFFANTQTDSDTVVKPTSTGFEEDTLLRSIASPEQLSFRVGLPEGANLVQAANGAVQVVDEGTVIASVLPVSAWDSAGTHVPVAMSVSSGNTLILTVDHRSGEYRYPIAVDPIVVDKSLERKGFGGSWTFTTDAEGVFIEDLKGGAGTLGIADEDKPFEQGKYGYLQYETQGESRIDSFRIYTYTGEDLYNTSAAYMAIAGTSYEAGPTEIPAGKCCEKKWYELAASGSNGNSALYQTVATSSGHGYEVEYFFEHIMYGAEVAIEQKNGPSVSFDTTDETVEGEYGGAKQNALYGNHWASDTSGKWGLVAKSSDPGLGVEKTIWSSPSAPKWGGTYPSDSCASVQCKSPLSSGITVKGEAGEEELPEGEDSVEAEVVDPVGLTAKASAKVKIDNAPPHNVTLSGLPSTHEISDGQHVLLKASATSALAGMASIVLTMDGKELGTPSKGCSPGECTTSGEWTLSGESYAAGTYTLAVVATDNAGNVTTEELQVTIHHAGDVAVGPGSVSPITGELALSATDVSVSAPDGNLAVGRSYRSRHLGVQAESPLGAQWSLSLGTSESLSRTPSGSMLLTGTGGEQSVFASNGKGGYSSPPGDAGLLLSEKLVGKATDFLLSENGAVTTFAVPTGGSGSVWEPSISEGAGGTDATTFSYKTEGGITEPTEELAPVPAGVSCSPTLNNGCRALKFSYAEKTKESIGEKQSEWGEYKGRLKEVTFTAYERASKEMKTKAVAQYAYDKQGRLRAEWNPQITPELKTIYGYDGEGHVTALAPAGQQPWLVEQGTTASDASPGRVLAFARPAATSTSALKSEMEAAAPTNTAVPTLSSTTPTVGVKISVNLTSEKTPGTWSNSPLAYSYQWQDCNTAGKECTVIPGAVNQSYYPVSSDEGHTLAAEVVALNANGAAMASSAATAKVAAGAPSTPLPEPPSVGSLSVWTLDYQVPLSGTEAGLPKMSATEVAKWGQIDIPAEGMAVFPPDKPMGWPAKEYTRASIYYLDGRDRSVNFASPTGGISTTEYNLYNDVIRTLNPDGRATALAAGEEKSKVVSKELDSESTYNEGGSEPGTELYETLGPKHTVELTNGTKAEAREHTTYGSEPGHLVINMTEGAQIEGKEEAASVRTTKTSYSGQNGLARTLRKPTSVTVEPAGLDLTHSMFYEAKTGNVTETWMPAAGAPGEEKSNVFALQFGKTGTKEGEFKEPQGMAVTTSGDEYVLDTANNRVQEFNANGKLIGRFSEQLKEPHGITLDSNGNVWVANTGDKNVVEFTSGGARINQTLEKASLSELQSVAVDAKGDVWVVSGNLIKEYDPGLCECNPKEYILSRSFGTEGSAEKDFKKPQGIAVGAEGNLYISDTGNNRVEEYHSNGEFVRIFDKEGGDGGLKAPHGISTDSAGDVWVADTGNNRIEEFGSTGTFIQVFGKEGTGEGKLKAPDDVSVDGEGDAWVADTANNNVQEWTSHGSGYGSGAASAHDTQTVYYTAGVNSRVAACGEHPEWANLPCQTQPAAQPEDELPKLAVTTYTYNIWDEPETTTNTSGTATRTTTATYDAAGRLKTTATSSTGGKTLPTVTYKYSETLGALEEQSNEGKTKPIISHYNTLGQLTSYTDAAESTTTYEYDEDGRIKKTNDGKGTETYTYSKTTGLPTELLNEYGTTKLAFTGTYDSEGNLLTEGYPDGMNAIYTYNSTGSPTGLEYKKTTDCAEEKEKCVWFKDSVERSIHGQWLTQESTLSKQQYTYDGAGRLTQVQNTPAGKGCTTRIYAYDADTNRTSLTTREPGTEGKCATEGGSEEKHTYDTADRLTDAGVSYNTFGDITGLPATDAGGKETSEGLTSEFYVDNQLASQKQGEQTIGYNLDPAGRTIETVATGKRAETITNHYAGPGNTPAWTSNTAGETTREIPGITGTLTATQSSLAEPVLQLTNLHGDIIATAYLSETATGLASKTDTSEYGVPTTSLPPKYSWLGSLDIPTELPSGALNLGARSYVPQLGRFLQPDPIPGGSANAYSYTFGDPVNTSDPTGESTIQQLVAGFAAGVAAEHKAKEEAEQAARRAAEEAAARTTAEYAALQASWAAYWAAGPQYTGGGEEEWYEEEWYEEEGEYEYARYRHGQGDGNEEAHAEAAVLYQPLSGEAGASEGTNFFGSTIPLCQARSQGPCAHDAAVLRAVRVRGFRLACTGAAVVAIACGGDDFQKEVQEQTQPVRSEYVGVQRPDGDDLPSDEPDDFDPFDFVG
jgi:RHS repeat-associated protein